MKTLITLFNKVFKSQKQESFTSDEELDNWIISIREKPQYSKFKCSTQVAKVKKDREPLVSDNNDDLEAAGSLVLA